MTSLLGMPIAVRTPQLSLSAVVRAHDRQGRLSVSVFEMRASGRRILWISIVWLPRTFTPSLDLRR